MNITYLLIALVLCQYITLFIAIYITILLRHKTDKQQDPNSYNQTPRNFFKEQAKELKNIDNSISIDDTKVVLNIDTNNLEKKYQELTKTTTHKNDISNSVNKLKNMKG